MRNKEPYCAVQLKDKTAIVVCKIKPEHDEQFNYVNNLNHVLMVYDADCYGEVVCEVPQFNDAVKIAYALNEEYSKWSDSDDLEEEILQEKWVAARIENDVDECKDPRQAMIDWFEVGKTTEKNKKKK